ncbi:MAG: cobalamin-independent methionine synthase II family protein [Muribaculaceae bacterium]|nr:cobalamin-independent methionine synthase II family protein [Muribaculaceae bacterium]
MKVEIVGSFLPPDGLMEARDNFRKGYIDPETVKHLEDNAVSDLVRRQLSLGLSMVTSGEIRRKHWDMDFWFGLDGISKARFDSVRINRNVESCCDLLRIIGPIGFNPAHPFFDDLRHLKGLVEDRAVCMQCLPSPADLYLAILLLGKTDVKGIYSDHKSLMMDIVKAYNATLHECYRLGCRSVQLDDTACGRLCEDNFTKRLLQGGFDLIALHECFILLINDSIKGLPADMETSFYLSGGDTIVPEWEHIEYPDNIMPKVLKEVKVDKFFLPMALDNDYQLEILRHVPDGKKVVLGLVDAHSPYPEDRIMITHLVSMSLRYISPDNLSLSPRTGFKLTSHQDRGLTYEDQWNKLSELQEISDTIKI